MSDTDFTPGDLAAAFVLGTLEGAELAQAEARLGTDAAFAAEVAAWEQRLAPLAALVPPVPPPAPLWDRIMQSLGLEDAAPAPMPVPVAANQNAARGWRWATFAAVAVAACLAGYIVARPPAPPAAQAFAVLAPLGGSTGPSLLALAGPDGRVTIRPGGAVAVPSGRDLELWQLPAGATRPASLGVLPASGATVAAVAPGTQLLVSLEPKGGSPTGQPTGPVIYGGRLTLLN